MSNFLITGGAGFIGSHLSEALLEAGHHVTVIDDLSTGAIQNIEHLKPHPKFKYVVDTIDNKHLLSELVDASDAVYHLAAAVGVKLIVESPVRTIETNIRGTELVLACADKKKKPVLIASTSEVYGKGVKFPFREDGDLTLGPTSKGRWSYACSKMLDEFLGLAYTKEKKLPVVVVRLFNTVGPRQTGRYGMVIPTFVRQALAGQPITVYGTGKQSRCFTHVQDVVGALIRLMAAPKAVGQVYNVGSSTEISINDVAKLVKAMTKSPSKIVRIPYNKAYEEGFEDMPRRVPDLTKLKKLIGYKPTKGIREILEDVIDFERGRQAA